MDLVAGERIVSKNIPRYPLPLHSRPPKIFLFPKRPCPNPHPRYKSLVAHAKKKGSLVQPILKQSKTAAEEEEEGFEEFEAEAEAEAEAEEYIEDLGDGKLSL